MPTKITERTVRNALTAAAKPGAKRITLRDAEEPGLRLVAGPRGGVWSFETTIRSNGARRTSYTTLGTTSEVGLIAARLEVQRLKADIRAGRDPGTERILARARATTLGAEAKRWRPKGRASTVRVESGGLRLALEEMGLVDAPPEALHRRDLLKLIEMHRGHPASIRRRIGVLRRFLEHLVLMDILATNVARTELPYGALPPPPVRHHFPTAAEVQRLWHAADGFKPDHRDLLRLLMLAPLRRSEADGLTAGEVDFAQAEIRLAPERTKNGLPFVMPLSYEALALVAPRVTGRSPEQRVFDLKGFFWCKVTTQWRRLAEVAMFKPHDLRRLFATEAVEHDIGDTDLVDGLLAHAGSAARRGVSGVYQRSARIHKRQKVMQAWADLVMEAVETGRWRREIQREAEVADLDAARAARARR